ncbi:major facilitator superfamily transporter [Colletotrichum plurivorum]|uniref:Major facilitator superfamily transporter n=1 Tax=Colletotrichum plurivorum TaxID=2175906 RepID=A0A8H6KQJ0_9PEZI|nr:major facilitator superfamily transporter [Colletotrichum plurivorum]
MDAKEHPVNPTYGISFESLHLPEHENKQEVDNKQDSSISSSASAPPTPVNASGQEADQASPTAVQPEDLKLKRRARWALLVMAFFMGDVQDGLGPFLGVYLQQRGWAPGLRGTVSTVSGVATILATGPIGALIDATKYKRLLVAACALLVGVSQGLNLLNTHPALVFSTQIVSAVAGTSMMPLLVALTLGICSPDGEDRDEKNQKRKHTFRALNGWNQAANHAGNMVSAGLAGLLGSKFGLTAVFWLVMAFCAATMGTVLLLPERAIDHAAARGGHEVGDDAAKPGNRRDMQERGRTGAEQEEERPSTNPREATAAGPKNKKNWKKWKIWDTTVRLFVDNRPLAVVAATIFLFHLGNAAILYLYGQALVAAGQGDPAGTTGLTVIIAQGTMVVVSLLTSWLAGRFGYWMAILLSYAVLPVRAAVAGSVLKSWGVWPVQILDGVGAGIQSVAIPGMLAVMMAGSGRVNVTFSIVGGVTRQTGASISHSLGGWMAQDRGYSFALYLLGIFPLISLGMWIAFYKMLRPAMDKKAGSEEQSAG